MLKHIFSHISKIKNIFCRVLKKKFHSMQVYYKLMVSLQAIKRRRIPSASPRRVRDEQLGGGLTRSYGSPSSAVAHPPRAAPRRAQATLLLHAQEEVSRHAHLPIFAIACLHVCTTLNGDKLWVRTLHYHTHKHSYTISSLYEHTRTFFIFTLTSVKIFHKTL